MQSALDMFLKRFITVGRLKVRWPDGRTQIYVADTFDLPDRPLSAYLHFVTAEGLAAIESALNRFNAALTAAVHNKIAIAAIRALLVD